MPVKPLPVQLVARLKKAAPRIEKVLGRMRNIDPRKDHPDRLIKNPLDTNEWGSRVRQMNISRNFPGVKLVIKKHEIRKGNFDSKQPAVDLVNDMYDVIDLHNSQDVERKYELVKPNLYAIGPNLIAMAKTRRPILDEVVGLDQFRKPSARGLKVLATLKEKHGIKREDISSAYLDLMDWSQNHKFQFFAGNMLFLGVKKGKFQFMPLADDW